MNQLHSDLQAIFRRVFDDEDLKLTESMSADDIDGWDSMAHINLIIAIEKRFSIKFAASDLALLGRRGQNVGTMMQIIAGKTGAGAGG